MLDTAARTILLDVARLAVESAVRTGVPMPVDPHSYAAPLCEIRASFVTLERNGRLRGCIGSLQANLPLVEDVARRAHSAALEDPRFPAVAISELDDLGYHVAVLGVPAPLPFATESDLLAALRPGHDGLILTRGTYRATFLPAVWASLETPAQFVAALKQKAGIPAAATDYDAQIYATESFPE